MKHADFKKSPTARAASCLLLSLGLVPTAWSQSDNVVMTVGRVVVTADGGALSPRRILTSVNVLNKEQIEGQTHYGNFELIGQVPGVMVGEYPGKGMGYGTITMRGFNGEGVLNAVKLLIDGVPSNANDGNTSYIDLVPRIELETIEVVKGTNDPRYGLHNIAGNTSLVTRQGGNYTQAMLTAGSFASQVLQLAKGIETDQFSQNYALSHKKTNGFRQHMEAHATSFSGKWFMKLGQGTSRIGLIVKHLDNDAEEPGYLSRAEFDADPWQVAPKSVFDRDSRQATQVAVQGEASLSASTDLQAQIYWNRLNDKRYIKFPDSSRQEFRQVRERHVGASVNLTHQLGSTALGKATLIAGIDTERQDNISFRQRPIEEGSVGQSVVPRRDHNYLFNTVGAFAQVVIKPDDRWTVTPALRVDRIDGEGHIIFDTTAALIGTWPINDYGLIKQPKISASYRVTDSGTVYANWGRTFQVGTGRAAYKTSSSNAGVSINEGWELGYKFKLAAVADARAAAWKQTAESEARTLLGNPSNDTVNLGQTVRKGIDLELNARPTASTSAWLGASFQKAQILSTGKEVDHVPRALYTLGVSQKLDDKWKVGATVTGQSNYFVDTTNPEKLGAFALVNATVGYKLTNSIDLDLQVRNLTNRLYQYAYDNVYVGSPGNFYAPNMPRSIMLSVNIKL